MKPNFIIFIFLLYSISSANAVTIDSALFEIYEDIVYITIKNSVADFFNVSTTGHYLDVNINGVHINFTTTANKTITGLTYSDDTISFTTTGAGSLTINSTMENPLTKYILSTSRGGYQVTESDESGNVIFTFESDSEYHYDIEIGKNYIFHGSGGTGGQEGVSNDTETDKIHVESLEIFRSPDATVKIIKNRNTELSIILVALFGIILIYIQKKWKHKKTIYKLTRGAKG